MSNESSLRVDHLHPAILRPGIFAVTLDRRALGSEAHRGELALGNPLQHQGAAHGLRAALTQADVVFARAALVGVALELQLGAGMSDEELRIRRHGRGKFGPDIGLVEVEVNDLPHGAARPQALSPAVRAFVAQRLTAGRSALVRIRVPRARHLGTRARRLDGRGLFRAARKQRAGGTQTGDRKYSFHRCSIRALTHWTTIMNLVPRYIESER